MEVKWMNFDIWREKQKEENLSTNVILQKNLESS